jgi:CO dehydrogenase/acetyl-CoA synthase gamma subunit (corrinoid Fe-S protein)
MIYANLYTDRINLARYLTIEECRQAGAQGPEDLASWLLEGVTKPEDCELFSRRKSHAISLALRADKVLPQVPSLQFPRQVTPNLFELNEPGPDAPVLVTGNSEFTLTVLTGVLSFTISPFYLLVVDCRGDTVDMSMVYSSFTTDCLRNALSGHDLAAKVRHRLLIIPGFCEPLREEFSMGTGWEISVGPVCAAELPLFLGEAWLTPPA